MKLTIILTIGICLAANAKGHSQNISLSERNASLKTVFKKIEQQTNYHFVYRDEWISKSNPVNLNITKVPLEEALALCFRDQPLTYSIIGSTIVIKQKQLQPGNANDATEVVEPEYEVTGTITDENGPLLSASVTVKGSALGTTTDAKGQFVLKDVKENDILVISFVGYESQEIPLAGKKVIKVKLVPGDVVNETVVVGYGQKRKEGLTTSVSTINANQITQMPVTNLSQVFASRIPGVLARTSAGSPGDENATLLVRTTNTSTPPLLVVDGVPRFNSFTTSTTQVSLRDIDPNEVESITVLKDNAAAAVYGARGANGVIIVTTKRGKAGKAQFSYTGNFTWSQPAKMVKNLDAYSYALAYNEYYTNSGLAVPYSAAVLDTIQRQLSPYKYANTDWVDLLTGTPGFVQNHSLGIRGGSEGVRYFVFGSYTDEGGMFSTVSFKRYTIQSNLDINLSKQFKAQVSMGYRNGKQDAPGAGTASTIMNQAINASPLVPVYLANGSYGSAASGGLNPVANISDKSGYQYTQTNYTTMTGRLTWEPAFFRGFSAYTNFNVEKGFTRGKVYNVPVPLYKVDESSPTGYTQTAGTGKPTLTDNTNDATSYTADFALNYNRQWRKHGLEALALYTVSQIKTNSNSDTRLNLVAPGLDILNLGATVGETTTGSRTQSARAGVVGRVGYSFDRRFYVESAFRFDGSTVFAPGHRWGFFPGASAGWVISKENFFIPLTSVVNNLKLRGSIGLTGDDNIGGNTYYYTYRLANTGLANTQGYIFGTTYNPTFYLANSTLPNEDITWAKNLQVNFGFDATLWKGKLGINFDIYKKHRYDILMSKSYNLPATFGIGGPIQNYGEIDDKGFDLQLTNHNQLSKDWSLDLTANVTYVKTRIVEYGTSTLPDYQKYEGHPTNTLVGYHSVGIFQNADEILKWGVDQDGLGNTTIKPGDVKFADLDGDKKLTAADQLWINNYGFPPVNLGFGINLDYKNFSLSAFFNSALGGYIKYANPLTWQFTYDNAWRPGNEGAKYPRLASSTNNSRTSDATLISDDFLRLRDLRLNYSLPKKWMNALKLREVKVYAQASNLFTWTSVMGGIDPETPNLGTGGVSGGFYPNQKNIGFGINVNF